MRQLKEAVAFCFATSVRRRLSPPIQWPSNVFGGNKGEVRCAAFESISLIRLDKGKSIGYMAAHHAPVDTTLPEDVKLCNPAVPFTLSQE